MTEWYRQTRDSTLQTLGVRPAEGLSSREVATRLQRYGPNELQERGGKSPLKNGGRGAGHLAPTPGETA